MFTVAVLASLLWSAIAGFDAPAAAADIVIDGKFDTATEEILIPVTIGGHAFWCSPDTAFSALITLDKARAVAAGLSPSPGISTPDGNPPAAGDQSATATVVVGGVDLSSQSIILRRSPEEAPDMDCVMGVALLRRFVVEFDYVKARLILHDRESYRPPPGSESVPLLFRANPRVAYADIGMMLPDGSKMSLRVVPDTGAAFYSAVLVGDAMARVRPKVPTARAVTYADPRAGRVNQIVAARPRAISVGPFTVTDPVIAFVDGSLGGGGELADGLLGAGFFRRFAVSFDFDGRAMYLRPNEHLSEPHLFDASGAGFIRRNGRHVVYAVIEDSPAAMADIRAGDVLREIDDRAAGELTPVQLKNLLSADGAERRLVLERDGRILRVVLRLRRRV
jgi:hypothetical protein